MAIEREKRFGLDWWSLIATFGAVVLIKLGVLPRIPW